MTAPQLPSTSVPLVDPKTGMMSAPWANYFYGLSQASQPGAIQRLQAGQNSYTASQSGSWVVNGTPTAITLTRAREKVSIPVTTGLIPAVNGDVLAVDGDVTVAFIPATGS